MSSDGKVRRKVRRKKVAGESSDAEAKASKAAAASERSKPRKPKSKAGAPKKAKAKAPKRPTRDATLAAEFDAWLDSGAETAFLTLRSVADGQLTCTFDDEPDTEFALTVPAGYPHSADGEHFFIFTESALLATWLMRLSDFCERRSTRSLAQVLSKAAAVYLDEVAGDDAQNAADDDAAGGGSDALSADDGGTFDGTALDDDDDALLGFVDGDVGGDEMAVDELDGDFSLQSAGFQESLNQLAMQKRWAAKEQELRDAAEREKARGRRGVNLEPAQKNSDKVQTIFSASGSSAVLTNDLLRIMKSEHELGFSAEPIDDNIYNWRVKLFNFDPSSRLARDMKELKERWGYDYVELDVSYKMDLYPFFPPFVKLLRPRFHGFMMGAIASSDLFKLSHWDPVREASKTLSMLRGALERDGAVDVGSAANDLTKFEDGAYSPLEHALLRLQLLSEVPARSAALINASEKIAEMPKVSFVGADGKAVDETGAPTAAAAAAGDAGDAAQSGAGKPEAWAKGTGYGYYGGGPTWDINAYLAAQAAKDDETRAVVQELAGLLQSAADERDSDKQEHAYATLEGSCLVPFLEQYLVNESLLDMSRHLPLYECIFSVVRALAGAPHLRVLLAHLVGQRRKHAIGRLLEARAQQCRMLLKKIGGGGSAVGNDDVTLARSVDTLWNDIVLPHKAEIDAQSAENEALEEQLRANEERASGAPSGAPRTDDAKQQAADAYKEALEELQFDECDMAGSSAYRGHHYASQIACEKIPSREKTLRAAQEQSSLCTSLPLSLSSSVFARVDESRIDVLRALITGPEDTPYENGCFLFDIFLPAQYPHSPPLVNLMTTGHGAVRFNPNLYNDGKVCLSLLGTWSGEQGESWNRDTSTLLQVFVSIQSLILVDQPYFNEPSYERSMHTTQGQAQSAAYNQNIRLQTLKFAVLEQLRAPSAGFEDVIRTHFRVKRDLVRAQLDRWIELADRTHKPRVTSVCADIRTELNKLN